jgi:UDPglucose 6-dehydrogenase
MLGVTFKPNTDDMRDSPSLEVDPGPAGRRRRACGPMTRQGWTRRQSCSPGVQLARQCPYEADGGGRRPGDRSPSGTSSCALDLERALEVTAAANPALIDLRNVYNPEEMRAAGFVYSSIGRAADGSAPGAGSDLYRLHAVDRPG